MHVLCNFLSTLTSFCLIGWFFVLRVFWGFGEFFFIFGFWFFVLGVGRILFGLGWIGLGWIWGLVFVLFLLFVGLFCFLRQRLKCVAQGGLELIEDKPVSGSQVQGVQLCGTPKPGFHLSPKECHLCYLVNNTRPLSCIKTQLTCKFDIK